MYLYPQSRNLDDYLQATDTIDYHDASVSALAEKLKNGHASGPDRIKAAYEYVRDAIAHSAYGAETAGKTVTCSASSVLKAREGICFAKNHLFAALLRHNGIPAGFCYQTLRRGDAPDAPFVLHGLAAVYVEELQRWVRLDTRGNKPGISAQFSLTKEILAYPTRPEKGEASIPLVFTSPAPSVVHALSTCATLDELWANLPQTLGTKPEE